MPTIYSVLSLRLDVICKLKKNFVVEVQEFSSCLQKDTTNGFKKFCRRVDALIINFESVCLQRFPIIFHRCRSENKLGDNFGDKTLKIRPARDTCITEISFASFVVAFCMF